MRWTNRCMRAMLDGSISKSEDKNDKAMKVQSEIRRTTERRQRSSNKVRRSRSDLDPK